VGYVASGVRRVDGRLLASFSVDDDDEMMVSCFVYFGGFAQHISKL